MHVLPLPSILLNHFIKHFLAEPQTLANPYESLMACGLLRLFLRVRTRTSIRLCFWREGWQWAGGQFVQTNSVTNKTLTILSLLSEQAEFVGIFLYQMGTRSGERPPPPAEAHNHTQETDCIWAPCPKQLQLGGATPARVPGQM